MKNQKLKFRFGLILETYCHAIGTLFRVILKQVNAVDKLSVLAEIIKDKSEDLSILKVSLRK